MLLLLVLQLLSWWAFSVIAVPVARIATASAAATTTTAINSATRRRRRSQAPATAAIGELRPLPRPRAARLLEKIGASLTEESAHFGFGPTQIFLRWENQKDAHLKMKHDGALALEFG